MIESLLVLSLKAKANICAKQPSSECPVIVSLVVESMGGVKLSCAGFALESFKRDSAI